VTIPVLKKKNRSVTLLVLKRDLGKGLAGFVKAIQINEGVFRDNEGFLNW